jgi:uncharacterized protein YndB with AHSA1/START domain
MDAELLFSLAVLATFAVGAIRITTWLNQIAEGREMLIIRRSLRAAPESVWICVMDDRHIPAIPGMTVRHHPLSLDGNRVATIMEGEDGWIYRTVDRITRLEPGRQLVRHVEDIDGYPEPFGSDHWETIALSPTETGTEIVLATQGQFGWANVLWLVISLNFTARRLRQAAEAA